LLFVHDVESAGSDEVLGEPDEAGRRKDADSADNADAKAEHECQGFHDVSFTLPNRRRVSGEQRPEGDERAHCARMLGPRRCKTNPIADECKEHCLERSIEPEYFGQDYIAGQEEGAH